MEKRVLESTVLSRASAHGRSQLKRQKLRVGGYTGKVLELLNYPRARAHPGYEINCQGVPHRRFVLCRGQPTPQNCQNWGVGTCSGQYGTC